jgi:hypothetical protein
MSSEIVLVAGVDFPKFKTEIRPTETSFPLEHQNPASTDKKAWNWRVCAERLMKLAARKYGKDLRVTLFDFARGTRKTWIKSGGELKRGEVLSLGALKWDNYRILDKGASLLRPLQPEWPKKNKEDNPPHIFYFPGIDLLAKDSRSPVPFKSYETEWGKLFDRKGSMLSESSISIIHVYDFIQTLGATRKSADDGGIRALHFLSHAWRGGPILVNTGDLAKVVRRDASKRDPFDKDGRAEKDFTEENYTRAQLAQFQNAFAKDAFAFIWGCDQTYFYKELIRQTIKQGKGAFQFKYDICWGDPNDLPENTFDANGKSKRFSLDDIRKLIQDALDDTYMQRLADLIRRPVIGAVPGTSSDPDRKGPADKLLWHVSIGINGDEVKDTECLHPSNLKKWLSFYKRELKVTFDNHFTFDLEGFKTEFGRGFVRFQPLVGS